MRQAQKKPRFFLSLTRKIAFLLALAFFVTSGATFVFWLFLSHTGGLPQKDVIKTYREGTDRLRARM